MSSISDGLSSIYSLTAQINALKNQTDASAVNSGNIDPKVALLALQKNFNAMLNELSVSSDPDKDRNKEESDPFAFLTNYQTFINNLNNQSTQGSAASNASLNINSYTGSIDNNDTVP
ncbi:hypothetical protein HZB08_00225 [Candidatus Saganbacteria bacterium]|uniref:Uncharacterized protein n=1 Tax=Candidatus Saganbacteria bacterium TaxID=2575572 RepID=A0A9D6UMP8_UNCSA|nr:hypothetical protein [Candidatus Saganbacteria bacterium]